MAHKLKASKKKWHNVSEAGSATIIRWKPLKGTYSVINVQDQVQTVGDIWWIKSKNTIRLILLSVVNFAAITYLEGRKERKKERKKRKEKKANSTLVQLSSFMWCSSFAPFCTSYIWWMKPFWSLEMFVFWALKWSPGHVCFHERGFLNFTSQMCVLVSSAYAATFYLNTSWEDHTNHTHCTHITPGYKHMLQLG
jgi:hypothetical protein